MALEAKATSMSSGHQIRSHWTQVRRDSALIGGSQRFVSLAPLTLLLSVKERPPPGP